MGFTWEAIYSFFSPPTSRNPSPQDAPSLFSSAFFAQPTEATKAKQTDLTMPSFASPFGRQSPNTMSADPSSCQQSPGGRDYLSSTASFGRRSPMPSPAESSISVLPPSERDYSPPTTPSSALLQRRPSASSAASGRSTVASEPEHRPQLDRSHTTPPSPTLEAAQEKRPSPRRSATEVVALDPMSRSYPKPAEEPSLEELLARQPLKYSLGHYVKHAKAVDPSAVEARLKEEVLKAREEMRRELLKAKEELESKVGMKGKAAQKQ
ncbi:uncharacterized protein B0T15DRAFT_290056 [Chaetomium strumarium]|uniref:Uncharacterized protein n=1 Tax=Chaetomium strumarium TaxID=1170767 RepID=A0AAJ0GLB2_9PEZI|nr:hypothetical protein B0T15DRAFT_290056 [Chaetomium strumarium]